MPDNDFLLHDPEPLDQLTADTDVAFRAVALAQFRLDLAEFAGQIAVAEPSDRRRLLHTMNSSAALMGGMRLAGLCLRLEGRAAMLGVHDIQDILRLTDETAALYATLE